MPLTFSPPAGPSFDVQLDTLPRVETTPRDKGYVASRPLGLRDLRRYRLVWRVLTQDQRDYLQGFFHEVRAVPFYWTPTDYEWSPLHATPTLAAVTSGALGARTVYVAFSWYNSSSTGETKLSAESSISTSSGEVVSVTVPIFPTMADRVRIYAGTSSGSLTLQTTATTRTWQEPDSGLVAGASPPSTNTLRTALLWVLDSVPSFTQFACNRWSCDATFQEVVIP